MWLLVPCVFLIEFLKTGPEHLGIGFACLALSAFVLPGIGRAPIAADAAHMHTFGDSATMYVYPTSLSPPTKPWAKAVAVAVTVRPTLEGDSVSLVRDIYFLPLQIP